MQSLQLFSLQNAQIFISLLQFDPDTSLDETLVFNTNTNEITLPLLIGNENELNTSRFILEKDTNLRLDENDTTNSNNNDFNRPSNGLAVAIDWHSARSPLSRQAIA